MTQVVKYTNPLGEKFYGLVLQWYDGKEEMAEIFWDAMRHPLLRELRVVYQCTVPHEQKPEIGWTNVTKCHPDAKIEIRDATGVKIKWESRDIAKLQASVDLESAMAQMDLMKYRNSNRANMALKDHKKHTLAAKESAKDVDSE
jgi:hypothetical protein